MATVDAGIGECDICCESVPFVKLLDCSHALCKACALRLLLTKDAETSIRCPNCRTKTIFDQHTADDDECCVDRLRSCYFGRVQCHDCPSSSHHRVDIIDAFFCHKCLIALCSTCSRLHNSQHHTTTRWNTSSQIDYCMQHMDQLRLARQRSISNVENMTAIDRFMNEVTKHLKRSLEIDPIAARIETSLVNRYGGRASRKLWTNIDDNSNNPIAMQHLIANVLQLSGIDQSPDTVPADNCEYRIRFIDSAESVAECIRQSSVVITKSDELVHRIDEQQQSIVEHRLSIDSRITIRDQMDLTADGQTIAICDGEQVINIYSMHSASITHRYRLAIAHQSIRSITFVCDNRHLLVASQSTDRHYNWMLHIYDVGADQVSPSSYPIDIDHDDRVRQLVLARSTGVDSYFYLRQCDNRVCQIWQIRRPKQQKSPPARLKDRLVYERGESQYESLQAMTVGKACVLIAWDRASCCLHRLIVQSNRCCSSLDRLLVGVEPIPFAIDSTSRRICCYDSHTKRFVHDAERSVDAAKHCIELCTLVEYRQQRRSIRTMSTVDGTVYALAVDDDGNLFMITINKLSS